MMFCVAYSLLVCVSTTTSVATAESFDADSDLYLLFFSMRISTRSFNPVANPDPGNLSKTNIVLS